jgi:hypothetical protein
MGRLSELYHRDDRLRLLFGVGAKHSDRKSRVSAIGYARMLRPYRDLMGRLSELYHRDDRLRLLSGVGAKHSDKKFMVSAICYARMLRPYRLFVPAGYLSPQVICPYIGLNLFRLFSSCSQFRGLSRMYCRIF